MIKVADKPSTDPAQQKLRLLKKQWNKDVSAFIDDLIHYKKLTNGQPNKFFKERSSIKEPIPADPATIIGSLAADFQQLSQHANAIIAAQMDYSKNRRKKQLKPAPGATPTVVPPNTVESPTNDLSKQLAAFEYKYELIAEASNPITRFFTKLLTPTFGVSEAARVRKYRMSLLDACVKTYKSAGKLQVEIVKSSPESINTANKQLHQFWNDWMLVYRGFTTYKSNMPPAVPNAGGVIETSPELLEEKSSVEEKVAPPIVEEKTQQVAPVKDEQIIDYAMEQAKKIISDYTKSFRKLDNSNMSGYDSSLESAITKFLKSPGQYKPLAAKLVITEYEKLISALNTAMNTHGNSMGEIASQSQGKVAFDSSDHLEAVAQDFLKKWVGKTKHQLSVFDKTSAYRLDMYKMAGEIRKSLDKMMNSLEKDMNVEELNPLVQQINHQVTSMRGLMRALHNSGIAPAPAKPGNKNPENTGWGERFDAMERYM